MTIHHDEAWPGEPETLGHYEPPLVDGGQGRDASDVVANSFLFMLFMLTGAGIVALGIGPWYLSVGVGVLVIVVAIVGSIASTPASLSEPTSEPLDTRG